MDKNTALARIKELRKRIGALIVERHRCEGEIRALVLMVLDSLEKEKDETSI